MIILPGHSSAIILAKSSDPRHGERGAALVLAILMMVFMSAIALGVLAVVQTDTKIAGSDLRRTETCYAAAASIEKMTNDFSALFARTSRPSAAQLHDIELDQFDELTAEGYLFPEHTLQVNTAALAAMGANPTVTIPYGPFGGLIANLKPYTLVTTAQSGMAQCKLKRDMNNYLIPLFQFGMFSDGDIELHPGAPFTFNGRIHANGNIYANGVGPVKFLDKLTTANEFIYDKLRNGGDKNVASVVSMNVGVAAISVTINKGSMDNGPNLPAATASPAGQQGYFPTSPNGTINPYWKTTSVAAAAAGTPNQFGGQLLTRTTGAAQLKLPLQLDNNPTRELIKRRMPNDSPDPENSPSALSDSRYHSKAEIRILIDDEGVNDASGISGAQNGNGVNNVGRNLSTFDPIPLPLAAVGAGGGRALWRINDNNTSLANSYNENGTSFVLQQQNGTAAIQADTVRGVKAGLAPPTSAPLLKDISGATDANPIVITSNGHGYANGDRVIIYGVQGNTNANGLYSISNVSTNTFRLVGSNGNNGYNASGTDKVYAVAPAYNALPKSAINGTAIPAGAGLTGRILIQVVDTNGVVRDVTREILSMGMTEGEPNAIVMLQRPLWAAFTQGSRDASNNNNGAPYNGDPAHTDSLTGTLGIFNTHMGATGEIDTFASAPAFHATYGYLTEILAPPNSGQPAGQPRRSDISNFVALQSSDWGSITWSTGKQWNSIVPINVYNVREGRINTGLGANAIYERGITNVVEINMRNLARWMDGVFDLNLLANTDAVSANIGRPDGYVVYISDRRGDKVKAMVDPTGANLNSTNGMVDNVDIYGPNGLLDAGEDVQNRGLGVGSALAAAGLKDITELIDPAVRCGATPAFDADITERAIQVAAWTNPCNYFRRSVRLFNSERLQVTNAAGRLSTILGITVASENMVYTWGNYNTTGINAAPPAGTSSLNDPTRPFFYLPIAPASTQVPASIVADAFFPLSKTWVDSSAAMYPDDLNRRIADLTSGGFADETSVRAGVIAGTNLSAMAGAPDAGNAAAGESRINGGMHNFPRFLEEWNGRFNFVGSLIPLYLSTQAVGQYNANSTIYGAPVRNWAFDTTFLQWDRLPPGTPMFQYISPTAFRQVL